LQQQDGLADSGCLVRVQPGLQRDIRRIADLNNGVAVFYRYVDTAQRGIGLYAVRGATDRQGAENVKGLLIDSGNGCAGA